MEKCTVLLNLKVLLQRRGLRNNVAVLFFTARDAIDNESSEDVSACEVENSDWDVL